MKRLGFAKLFLLGSLGMSLFFVLRAAAPPPRVMPDAGAPVFGEWARTTLQSLTLEEKIGQLFMTSAYSKKDEAHVKELETQVRDYHVGGFILMQGGPGRQINLVNRLQGAAKVPLLMSTDAEWGLTMRLDSTLRFPRNMALGAIRDSMPLFELGLEVGRQCRRVGVHVNFAPVVDVNNNPANPVINDRSYGENPVAVATKGIYFMRGMEYGGTAGCAKHFPGHGDTDTDSHMDLPVIRHDRTRLDAVELYPFRRLIAAGVPSVMVAHLYIPALDSTPNLATTLSPKVVDGLLRQELKFQGLTFTDALDMKGVAKYFERGEVDLRAFLAGNDVLLFSGDVPKAAGMIRTAIQEGKVPVAELDRRVLKILLAKEWMGLNQNRYVSPKNLQADLFSPEALVLKKRLYQQAVTMVRNEKGLLPLGRLENRSIACVELGSSTPSAFASTLRLYAPVDNYTLPATHKPAERDTLLRKLQRYNTVIVGIDDMRRKASDRFGITAEEESFLSALRQQPSEVVLTLFGSPYALRYFGEEDALLVAYENDPDAKTAAAEAIMGGIRVDGVLPVTASAQFPVGTSLVIPAPVRLSFELPEAAGMDGATLRQIDDIATAAIKDGATPGCAVLVARGNKVVFSKGYGNTEYMKGSSVDPRNTLYDLASVSKVCGTTMAVMRLAGEGKLDIEAPVSQYLAEFSEPQLAHIRVRNLLLHNAGFTAWIPFYESTYDPKDKGKLRADIYQKQPSEQFCIPVAPGLYMCPNYQDSMWTKIVRSDVKTDQQVKYSDLSMIVMQRIVEKITGEKLDAYLQKQFYKPLGMGNTLYNPAVAGMAAACAPTEMDNYWRKTKVQGYVHDQAAAMFGGVSGHAGLFSNTYDLAKLLYMVQNGGRYGDAQYLNAEVIRNFTASQPGGGRRGLGWDKSEGNGDGPCSQYASAMTYGHLGFTGIAVWVDPKYDLIFVFLSNRTYPDANNKKLSSLNVRPAIHDKAYEAIFNYRK